jgi:hypothetical protein
MRRVLGFSLFVLVIGSAFWAYMIGGTLIGEMKKDASVVDLGTLFVLGLISGLALSQLIGMTAKRPSVPTP